MVSAMMLAAPGSSVTGMKGREEAAVDGVTADEGVTASSEEVTSPFLSVCQGLGLTLSSTSVGTGGPSDSEGLDAEEESGGGALHGDHHTSWHQGTNHSIPGIHDL